MYSGIIVCPRGSTHVVGYNIIIIIIHQTAVHQLDEQNSESSPTLGKNLSRSFSNSKALIKLI